MSATPKLRLPPPMPAGERLALVNQLANGEWRRFGLDILVECQNGDQILVTGGSGYLEMLEKDAAIGTVLDRWAEEVE